MIARYEECAGCADDMKEVEEKRGGLVARTVVCSSPAVVSVPNSTKVQAIANDWHLASCMRNH